MDTSKSNKSFNLHEFPPISTAEWEAVIESDLKGKNYKDVLNWDTGEGIELLPFYRSEHLENLDGSDIKKSTEFPDQAWEIRELINSTNLETANSLALEALKSGATALFIDLNNDLIKNTIDLEQLFNGVIIEIIGIHFAQSLSGTDFIQLFESFVEQRGYKLNNLDVTFQLDPITQSLVTGDLIEKDELEELVNDRSSHSVKSIAILASEYHNMGATIVDELAYSLATANEYLGMNKEVASNLHFNFGVASNYFLEISKLRAFRILWKQVCEAYEISDHKSYISAETSQINKSFVDGNNNILRVTTEAMSAALGTADSIMIRPFDELYEDQSTFSHRISRNIHHLMMEESYLNKVDDVSEGSYYIEMITKKLVEMAWTRFQFIETKGGITAILAAGFLQDELKKIQEERQRRFTDQNKVMVGVNKYPPSTIEKKNVNEIQNKSSFTPKNSISVDRVNYFRYATDFEKGVKA